MPISQPSVGASPRAFSLSHLSMMEVAPVDLVRAAGDAGYEYVGIRLVPTSDGTDHDLFSSPRKAQEIARALDDTGVRMLDVEVLRVLPDGFGDLDPFFELAAAIGAHQVICTVEDTDKVRRVDSFGWLCELAGRYGVTPMLEYMVFTAIGTVGEAVDLVRAVGVEHCVLVDALHHDRGGGTPEGLLGLGPWLAPYLQICDSPVRGRMADVTAARTEAVYGRLLPGAGALPLVELLGVLDRDTVISVECPTLGQRLPSDPAAQAARMLAAARSVVEQADASRAAAAGVQS